MATELGSTRSHELKAKNFVLLCVVSWIVIAASLLTSCQRSTTEPVPLNPEDQCSYCRMVISEKRYAAELIDNEGQATKFDDISCMTNFMKSNNNSKFVAQFVMDFDERQWIKAEDAYYVRSRELNTPMSGGIVAFRTQTQAEGAAARFHGQLLRFSEIVNR